MLKSILTFFLNPFNTFLMLALAAGIAGWLKRIVWFRRFAVAAVIWLLISSTGWIPGRLIVSLEYQHLPVSESTLEHLDPESVYIVVLGGGHGFNEKLPANSLLSENALGRLTEGIRIHHRLPGSRLVLSGYSATGRTTNAEMMMKTALLLGVDGNDILLQNEPAITYEEAKQFAGVYQNGQSVIVVTSAAHIPRAVMLFEKCGVPVIPSPANYRFKDPDRRGGWFPSYTHMEWMRISLYEYAGRVRDSMRTC